MMLQKLSANEVVSDFLFVAKKHKLDKNVKLQGSAAYGGILIPFWSDIDATIEVERVDVKMLRRIERMRTEYMRKHVEIPLSLTVTEKSDTILNNYFHHHGVKPIAYNFELSKLWDRQIPFKQHRHVMRASSVYRYYEILHTFRRDVVTTEKFTASMVAKGYHRLSRLLRTQVEILHPEMVVELGKLWERSFLNILKPKGLVKTFFSKFDTTKENWLNIMQDQKLLQKHGEYLAETVEKIHELFVPELKEMGGWYDTHYR